MWLQIVVGLVTVIGSMAMLFSPETSWNAPAAVLMGLGLGLVTGVSYDVCQIVATLPHG